MSYSTQLQKISQLIGRPATVLKQIGPSPKGMSRYEYIAEILPQIDNFMITDKADGTRGIIDINGGIAHCIIGSDYLEFPVKSVVSMIIDCEIIKNNKILAYDILEHNGRQMIDSAFSERQLLLSDVNKITSPEWTFIEKKFYKLSVSTYQKNIMALYTAMKKYTYKTDGIIFTSVNTNYAKTKHFKWKPAEHLTIDFLYTNNELWSGISRRQFRQIGMQLPPDYQNKADKWTKIHNGQLFNDFFPVPFMPSIMPYIYKHPINWGKSKQNANDQIIEVSYDVSKKMWHFHRIRADRTEELKSGTYYGNNFKIAELTLEMVINPLTIHDLVKSQTELSQGFYFEKSDDAYMAVRKFNSYVKGLLIKRYANTNYVIDMASGKGQDLKRYYDAGIKNLLMLEIDQSAIDEIITRKYEFSSKLFIPGIDTPIQISNNPSSTSLVVVQIDLNKETGKNISTIEHIIPKFEKAKVDVIICNMALHYMVGSSQNIKNIVKFVSYWLRDDGDFVFTSMSSQNISKLLGSAKEWSNGVYKIEKKDPNHIKVLLPCSRELREEPLVNIMQLDKEFNNHGIVRIETRNFDEFLQIYMQEKKNAMELDEPGKKFVGLYHYCVYKKIKK